jgi:hypothetical protein
VNHEQSEVYTTTKFAHENWISDMLGPNGQALAFSFVEVTSTHNGPTTVTCEDPPACLDLVIDLSNANQWSDPAKDSY